MRYEKTNVGRGDAKIIPGPKERSHPGFSALPEVKEVIDSAGNVVRPPLPARPGVPPVIGKRWFLVYAKTAAQSEAVRERLEMMGYEVEPTKPERWKGGGSMPEYVGRVAVILEKEAELRRDFARLKTTGDLNRVGYAGYLKEFGRQRAAASRDLYRKRKEQFARKKQT